MGWSPEILASVTHEKPLPHTSGLRLVSCGNGIQHWSTNQARNCMAQGRQGSSLLSLPDLPEQVFRSVFLHLYLNMHSGPVLNMEASCSTTQSTAPPPFFRRRGTSAVGPRWVKFSSSFSRWSPFTRVQRAGGPWERSGSFHHSEERVSAGCEPTYALFVEKHFLINQPVFDRVFTETTASPRAGKCDCGSS